MAAGLVHIKGYYVEFVKSSGRLRRLRRCFYGSANATEAAFHGSRNAELIASVNLSAGKDSGILDCLTHVIAAVESSPSVILATTVGPLHNSPILHLPKFEITTPGPAPGFDAWLQRGVLAAKYRDVQQFLTVSVVLQKRLQQDIVAAVFSSRGLLEPGERNVVRFRYMREVEDGSAYELSEDDDHGRTSATTNQWKSRYCVWTHFDDWLSDDCYRAHRADMVLRSGDRRRAKIKELRNCGENKDWEQGRKTIFLQALSDVWTELAKEGRPNDYLKGGPHGIDREHYGDRFEKKLLTDYRLAQDSDFRARYIDGYEFPAMLRFRQDTVSWDDFVRSWCESVALEAAKRRPSSLLARTLVLIMAELGIEELDSAKIYDWLRKSWNKPNVGERLMAYHEW